MQKLLKKHCLTWLMIAMLALALVGCSNNNDFSTTVITTGGSGQQDSVQDVVVTVVTVPQTADTTEHQYTTTVPVGEKSALTLLQELGKEKNFPVIIGSGYVESIDGVAQFDAGAESGWLYLVNGQMASVSADQYIPQAGDVINWIYITSYDQLKNFESME